MCAEGGPGRLADPRGAAAGRALCAIVWAGAPGAVVVCSRAELCAAPAPWSPAAAGIGRSSSVAQCSGNGGGEEHFTLILGLPRLPQPLTCTFLPQFPISAAPAWVSPLPFSPSGTVSGLGIVRSSGTGRGNHSLMLGADIFTSVADALTCGQPGTEDPGLPPSAVGPCISELMHPETRRVPPRQSAVPRNFSADVGTLRIPAWSPSPVLLPAGHSCQRSLLGSAHP